VVVEVWISVTLRDLGNFDSVAFGLKCTMCGKRNANGIFWVTCLWFEQQKLHIFLRVGYLASRLLKRMTQASASICGFVCDRDFLGFSQKKTTVNPVTLSSLTTNYNIL
jgi:hypothetical protein